MKNPFKSFVALFKKPTAHDIAKEKLDQAQIQALQHTEAANYHTHLRLFYEQQVQQLDFFLGNQEAPKVITKDTDPKMPDFPTVDDLAGIPTGTVPRVRRKAGHLAAAT